MSRGQRDRLMSQICPAAGSGGHSPTWPFRLGGFVLILYRIFHSWELGRPIHSTYRAPSRVQEGHDWSR
ncbi:hypothetical protein ABIE67_010077 [Streptomyces sp. V4I8]